MLKNKFVVALLVSVPFVLVIVLTLFLLGVRKYGTPAEYRQTRAELMQAREDSLRALETASAALAPVDSTRAGAIEQPAPMAVTPPQTPVNIQASLDSLARLSRELNDRETAIAAREAALAENLARLQSENTRKLAVLYDNMRTNLALPIFLSMNDTLAVSIISLMEERTAAQLLGSLAASDAGKAVRLNNLLVQPEGN